MRIRLLSALLFASLAGAGCAGSGQVHYGASVTTPDLVYVSPGVQVIADYDEPVFYSDNYYWRYDAGVWYRSPYHTRGWVRVYDVPTRIRQIDRPTAYIRYRSNNRTVVRDNRDDDRRRQLEREQLIRSQEQQRAQERRELVKDRNEQRQEDRKELIEERKEDRQEDRQKLIEQRERERQIERQKLIQQREREQREKERERARGR